MSHVYQVQRGTPFSLYIGSGMDTKKVLLYEKNDETPRIQDLRAPVLCNPPAL